jgi:hypothetical protein
MFDIYERYPGISMYIENIFDQANNHLSFIDQFSRDSGVFLPLIKDTTKKGNKEQRISALLPFFTEGMLFFNVNEREKDDLVVGLNQFFNFDISGTGNKHDDYPDVVEMVVTKLNKYRNLTESYRLPSMLKTKRELYY